MRREISDWNSYFVAIHNHFRVFVDLAMQCETPGLRVFRGFTVGFHPRTWEIVRDVFILTYMFSICVHPKVDII